MASVSEFSSSIVLLREEDKSLLVFVNSFLRASVCLVIVAFSFVWAWIWSARVLFLSSAASRVVSSDFVFSFNIFNFRSLSVRASSESSSLRLVEREFVVKVSISEFIESIRDLLLLLSFVSFLLARRRVSWSFSSWFFSLEICLIFAASEGEGGGSKEQRAK